MRHASLFSGIGGFDLAAQWMGWENVFQVEKDKWCTKILEKNFPSTKRFGDIKNFKSDEYKGAIDIISGGFPCQPFSVAGKQRGKDDDRYLWEAMLRVIATIKPTYVVGENVTGIIGLALDTVLSDLEAQNYTTETFVIPACGKGAWHRRDRVWIVAYTDCYGTVVQKRNGNHNNEQRDVAQEIQEREDIKLGTISTNHTGDVANTNCRRQQEQRKQQCPIRLASCGEWKTEPAVGRVVDGLPNRVDRLKGLGNAIVPQVAFEIFSAIDLVRNS